MRQMCEEPQMRQLCPSFDMCDEPQMRQMCPSFEDAKAMLESLLGAQVCIEETLLYCTWNGIYDSS